MTLANIGMHGLKGQARVLEGFALVDARAGVEGQSVGRKALAGYIKGCFRARAVFGKNSTTVLPLEGRSLFFTGRLLISSKLLAISRMQITSSRAQLRYIQQILWTQL